MAICSALETLLGKPPQVAAFPGTIERLALRAFCLEVIHLDARLVSSMPSGGAIYRPYTLLLI